VAELPVGPARARQLRLLQIRERLMSGDQVDVDAVATAIARRAAFTSELSVRLAAGEL
jgi:hypothetical protein